jgi:predicted dehydrogenase
MIERPGDMTPSAPTVGIIGLSYGRAHISAFQANGCKVIALCQRDQAAAKTLADRYSVPAVFGRWDDLLESTHPDIVVIATPPPLHHPIALRAFAQGAHVLCEKPLAMSRVEGEAMAEAAEGAKRVAMTSFNWRFPAAMQELHARAAEGVLGRVFHVNARWLGGRWAKETDPASWRMDRAQAGHGSMGDMGVHALDFVRWTFGEIVRVTAKAGVAFPERQAPGVNRPADAEDHCAIVGELESGATVSLVTSRVARGMNEHTLEAYGSGGSLAYRFIRDGDRWWEGELRATGSGDALKPVTPRRTPAPSVADGDPMEIVGKATIGPLVARFLEAIRTGTAASPSFRDGVRAQAVLDAVLDAATQRDWVEVAR